MSIAYIPLKNPIGGVMVQPARLEFGGW